MINNLPYRISYTLSKVYPQCQRQRCWVHNTANVLDKLPRSVQPQVKSSLHDIYLAPTLDDANNTFDNAIERFEAKYPKAMQCLADDLLSFYDFPVEHVATH